MNKDSEGSFLKDLLFYDKIQLCPYEIVNKSVFFNDKTFFRRAVNKFIGLQAQIRQSLNKPYDRMHFLYPVTVD